MRYLLVMLFTLALAGCSTSRPDPSGFQDTPPSRLMRYQNTPSTPYATLVVLRDKGWMAGPCRIGVYIDDQFAGSLSSAEKATFRLPAGSHSLSLGQDGFQDNTCVWRDADARLTQTLQAGETRLLRISGQVGQGFTLRPDAAR
ncbi:hypothetical protein FJU30_14880 [Affinibrenneria salicis]|uniref:PEGA domain-containing protein n=1 Tax=Affinibrenneria salicis TaxID=2590031 RepID=A0A5J5FYX0_9GAMM|nr:hypothetical protein [Affinibrenneria salicis]KAA8998960.1 hypothetical protein FJU30_14880 [Affinibrenneria salicis]